MKKFKDLKKLGTLVAILFVSVAIFASVFFCVPQGDEPIFSKATSYEIPVVSSQMISELEGEAVGLDAEFSLRTSNPILTENQTTSNFCWSYASLKALESAFMVQQNEYHNFSDVGVAYAHYYDQLEQLKGDKTAQEAVVFNSSGRFETFNDTITKYGLIYESDFSNSKFVFDKDGQSNLNLDNYENYKYLLNLADKNITKRIQAVNLTGASEDVLKAFIKKYGGVFAGIDDGKVSTEGKLYRPGEHDNDSAEMNIPGNHAVCLIGWDDSKDWDSSQGVEGGFRVLNSWGVATEQLNGKKQHEEFFVDYKYNFSYLAGWIIQDDTDVELESSNASTFSTSIKTRTTPLNNFFTYNETVDLTYDLADKFNFKNVYAKIFKGTEEVSHCFYVTYDDANSSIKIKEKGFTNIFEGGTFLVKIFEDVNLISVKEFVIYTSTELSYVELYKYEEVAGKADNLEADSYMLMNTLSSSDDTSTYYVSADDTYHMRFYFTDIFKVGTDYTFSDVVSNQITTVRAYKYVNGEAIETPMSGFSVVSKQQYAKMFELSISGLSSYAGYMVEFEIYLNSTMYQNVTKTLHFQMFLSANAQIQTVDAFNIEYVLDGGSNSSADELTLSDVRNIDRFPKYQTEENALNNMTSFKLEAPTKTNYEFLGWFLDPEFAPDSRIYVIDATYASDLVLYAKWLSSETPLFEVSLEMTKATTYGGESKSLDADFVYGDKLEFASEFTVDSSIAGLFSAKIYFIVNGEPIDSVDNLTQAQNFEFVIDHQKLFAGGYDIEVVLSMVISHMEKGSVSNHLRFEVFKKQLEVQYDNVQSTLTYDGNYHTPTVLISGKYDFDSDITFEWNRDPEKDAKIEGYEFLITSISNPNYAIDFSKKHMLVIKPKEVEIFWSNFTTVYNGTIQKPTLEANQNDILSGDNIVIELKTSKGEAFTGTKNAGQYSLVVDRLSNPNYKATTATRTKVFEIKPAELTLTFKPITERLQTAPKNRKQITEADYEITGTLFVGDTLDITTHSEGLTATESGEYEVTATYHNNNYYINVINGKYTLTGDYYVDYILPNGEVYREHVEDGKDPQGINRDIYDIPGLSGYKYSQKLKNVGQDLTIKVSVVSYSWILYVSLAVVGIGGIYWFMTRKARRNKVS